MLKLRKGDTVQVIKGKDKGKKGKILRVLAAENRVVVEGINMMKKHMRRTQQDKGGIVSVERPMSVANIMFLCKNCSRPVRVGFKLLKDESKVRMCKRCKEAI